jgi:broad specificity phosphatase PhoE
MRPTLRPKARLAASALRAYAPTVFYCSALPRARQTADIVAQIHECNEIVYDPRLKGASSSSLPHCLTVAPNGRWW